VRYQPNGSAKCGTIGLDINRVVTHTYDQERSGYFNKGALTTLSSPEAVYEFNYDNMGRQVKEQRTIDSTSYQTDRKYDIAGRLEHIIYPDTARTQYNYQYNGMGYLREVRKQGASYPYINIQDTDYNALGQIKNSHYGNGVNTAYAYYEDGSYRLKDITTTRNGTPIKYIHYEFDEAGNIEAMDVTTHTSATYTVNHDFTYDDLNRLKTATATCSNDSSRSYNQGYAYDLAGNMTNKTGIGGWDVLTWESAVNKPRMRPKSVRYDADVAGIANRNIINNQDQKPVQITYQGSTTNLYYDGTGERIKKVKGTETVIYVGGIYEVRNGQAMSYIYANGQKIVTLTNNKEYYTHSDHLGSTGIVTDETGTVVEEIGYLPFGSTLFRNTYNGSTWASTYRFTGQEFDPEYHLYNYNARLYDPIMSRFITPDTIVPDPYNPQSLNRYTYCLNNPLTYIDPSGHTSMTYDEWLAYMAMAQQAYSLYQVWPQMGGIMLHDFLMGFDSFQTGFEVAAVDPDTAVLAQLLAGTQSSGGSATKKAETSGGIPVTKYGNKLMDNLTEVKGDPNNPQHNAADYILRQTAMKTKPKGKENWEYYGYIREGWWGSYKYTSPILLGEGGGNAGPGPSGTVALYHDHRIEGSGRNSEYFSGNDLDWAVHYNKGIYVVTLKGYMKYWHPDNPLQVEIIGQYPY
jgi:RHS repeat-associated protein